MSTTASIVSLHCCRKFCNQLKRALDWSERGGIVGRGVLVDYATWAAKRGTEIKPGHTHAIPLRDVLSILREENVSVRAGDILIIRSGLVQKYESCQSDEERMALMHTPNTIGLEASEETVRWLWNQHFAAVAGDAVAFESQPFATEFCKFVSRSLT